MTESAQHPDVAEPAPVRVSGTVRLMTEDPIPVDELEGGGVWAATCRAISARPWLVPAVLLGLTSLVLLARRRR